MIFFCFGCSANQDVYNKLKTRQSEAEESLTYYETKLVDLKEENNTLRDQIATVPELSDYDLQLFNEDIYSQKANVNYTGDNVQDEIIRGTYFTSDYGIAIFYSSGLLLTGSIGTGGYGEMIFCENSYNYDSTTNQLTFGSDYDGKTFNVEFKDNSIQLISSDGDSAYDGEWIRYE